MRESKVFYIADTRNVLQPLCQTVWWFLKILKIELEYDPKILLWDIDPKELEKETWTDICTPILIAALSTIARAWTQPMGPTRYEQTNMTEYYLLLKRKKILTYVTKWVSLEYIIGSEIS
jgi:hypothetical protein